MDVIKRFDPTDLSSESARRAVRIGWLAKGGIFVIIGMLGLDLARRGFSRDDADQNGALSVIAGAPAGRVLVLLVSLGLLLFAIWKLWSAVADDGTSPLELAQRIGTFGLAVAYALLGVSGVQIAAQGTSSQSGQKTASPETIAAALLGAPAGRFLLVVLGLGTMGVAGYHLWKGVSLRFLDDIESDDLERRLRVPLTALGVAGFLARAAMLAIAGWLFISAARNYDPDRAAGLDESLRAIAEAPFGRVLIAAASVGLIAAGLYDAITFRRQQLN